MEPSLIGRLADVATTGGAPARGRRGNPPRHGGRAHQARRAACGGLVVLALMTAGTGPATARAGAQSAPGYTIGGKSCLVDGAVASGVCYLTGDIPAGQTFTFNATKNEGQLQVTGPTTIKGTLAVDNGGANGAFAWVTGGGSLTVASGGTLSTTGPSDSSGDYIQVPLTNQAGGTVDFAVLGPPPTNSRAGTSFSGGTRTVNSGAFDIAHGASVLFTEGSTFTQSAGTLKVNGALMVSGSGAKFTLAGGTESGGPVDVASATLVEGPGRIGFDLTGICTLTGDIPAGQTVTFDAIKSEGQFHLTGPTTVKGTLAVDVGGYGRDAWVIGGGSLTIASGGTLSTTGPSNSSGDYIQVPLTNQAGGTVDFAVLGPPPTNSRAGTSFSGGTRTVNSGAFDIAHGASVLFTEGSTFTQSAGTLKVNGALMVSGSGAKFTLAGGTESGGPVDVASATLVEGPGRIGFDLTGICTLTGDIPAGQTVTLAAVSWLSR